jgi:quercetin 2,3-dioxygenase
MGRYPAVMKTGEKAVARVERPAPRVVYGDGTAKQIIVGSTDHAATSPFLRMPEDWFRAPGGFPAHPHRGMQTVTIMLEGELAHADHTGAQSVIRAGDIQWMTAGRGVLHSEMPHGDAAVHCLQLWLNLPARQKMIPPSYVNQRRADTPVRVAGGARVRVYSGRSGDVVHPHGSTWPLSLFEVELDADARYVQDIDLRERTFMYVLDGSAQIGAVTACGGDVVWFATQVTPADPAGTITIAAATAFRALLFSSPVIDEPVVAHGPFVMNTTEEIRQAYDDLRTGRFIATP